jgi:photosystem I P700 chlorophyll a apoprotein A2
MAKFPKFSQTLAQDQQLKNLVWYTAHDLEAHDGMTEENLYQRFSLHISVISRYLLWTAISCRGEILKHG